MKFVFKSAMFAVALGAISIGTLAQNTAPSPVINQRKDNQQERIGNGVENGSLTAGEATHLEKKETRINREENRMKSDGNFTAAERARIRNQQSHLSKQIYNQKHDAQVQNVNPKSEVGSRQREQQERIGQGIKSGSLTPAEAARMENQEKHINREVARDRSANGGTLTPGERAKVNHQQNKVSRHIYRQKHDAQTRH
ncbi:MAG TPA: hypothetical protein VFU86_10300 [Terriglobales bacterium]|nr:hypothetical protein [Terriglobales bacterium]